jgi:hypothetical protein
MIADRGWRHRPADERSRRVGESGVGAAARGATSGAIAALAVGFAATAPACAARFVADDTPAAVVTVLITTTVLVVLFAAAAIVTVDRIERLGPGSLGTNASSRRGRNSRLGGCAIGAAGGLSIAGAVVATGSAIGILVALGMGVASAAMALLACTAGIDLAQRRTGGGLAPGTSQQRVRGWFVVAGVFIGAAVALRHTTMVGADLVPYVMAGAVASAAAGALRPVARWIGWRAVRVTEVLPDRQLDVTVRSSDDDRAARTNEVADEVAEVERTTGRFARSVIAAAGYLARRRDLDLIVALVVAGVVIAGAAMLTWTSGATARHDRAAVELGADRVLTVAPIPSAQLMADVRAADPTGRYAMAAAIVPATGSSGAVVAVDGQRYAGVVAGGVRMGPTGRQLAALLRPKQKPLTDVTGGTRQLNAITSDGAGPADDLSPVLAGAIKVTRLDAPVPGVPIGGVLVDLAAAAPIVRTTSQVWLAADAPSSLVDDLAAHGLRVVASTSIRARAAHYADQPATTVARIQLLAGLVMLCCAALVIGAVTRAHRGARTVARGVGLVTTVWALGVIGALAARHAGPDPATGFVDGWARVRPPPLVATAPFALFALASAIVLAAPVVLVAARRRPRPGVVDPPGSSQPRGDRPDAGCPAVSDGPRTVHR